MKSKDLIALLQRIDPSGESIVCVNNSAIRADTYNEGPGYYDGRMDVPTYDEHGRLSGAQCTSAGYKFNLVPVDIHEEFVENIIYSCKLLTYTSDRKQSYVYDSHRVRNNKLNWLMEAKDALSNRETLSNENTGGFALVDVQIREVLDEALAAFEEYAMMLRTHHINKTQLSNMRELVARLGGLSCPCIIGELKAYNYLEMWVGGGSYPCYRFYDYGGVFEVVHDVETHIPCIAEYDFTVLEEYLQRRAASRN